MKRSLSAILAIISVAIAMPLATAADPVESEIEAPGPDGPLKGLMLSPDAKSAPVVLIIPGSGPTDRNGNSLHGLRPATLVEAASPEPSRP